MSLDFSLRKVEEHEVYARNITHNLGKMAQEAGIYDCLWRPHENGFEKSSDIIPVLEEGLEKLKAEPEKYQLFNPANGWGDYASFVDFVEDVLGASKEHPEATISAHI